LTAARRWQRFVARSACGDAPLGDFADEPRFGSPVQELVVITGHVID